MIDLHNVDCMEYMKGLLDNAFDLAIVDPPYFSGPDKLGYYGERTSKTGVTRGAFKKTKEWEVPGEEYFVELKRVSKNQIVWGVNYYSIENLGSGRIIWDKCNEASSFSDCEIAYCSCIEHVKKFTYMWNGMMQGKSIEQGSVQQGNKNLNEKRIHPTQKPTKLYIWLLQTFAKPNFKILDTHIGSGSIAIACHDMNFDLVGCELSEHYFELAKNRIEDYQKQLRLF